MIPYRIKTKDSHRALIRASQTLADFDGGGLTGSIWTKNSGDFSGMRGKGHPVNGQERAVADRQILDNQSGLTAINAAEWWGGGFRHSLQITVAYCSDPVASGQIT
jgi:hypothetical protein